METKLLSMLLCLQVTSVIPLLQACFKSHDGQPCWIHCKKSKTSIKKDLHCGNIADVCVCVCVCAFIDRTAEELDKKWSGGKERMTCSKWPKGGNDPRVTAARTQSLFIRRPLYPPSYKGALAGRFLCHVHISKLRDF